MVKIKSTVLVRPIRSAKVTARLGIEHKRYPKSDRVTEAVKVVTSWARAYPGYRGKDILVEAGTLKERDQEGLGRINLSGMTVAHFSVLEQVGD